MSRILRSTCVLLVLALFLPFAVFAQISLTAPITGVVSDTTGAVIPGAGVTVRNNGTNAQFETLTVENGTFIVPALTPGVYTVTVSLPGFKQVIVPDVKLDAGTPATVRVTLEVGDVTQSVTVEAANEIRSEERRVG